MSLFFIFSINGSTQATSLRALFAERHFNAKVCSKRRFYPQLLLKWTNSILFLENTLDALLVARNCPVLFWPLHLNCPKFLVHDTTPINFNVERIRAFHAIVLQAGAIQRSLCVILNDY